MAFEGFKDSLVALKNALTNILNNILNAINNLLEQITTTLNNLGDNIINAISNVVDSIIDKIKYLFIPSGDFFSDKFNQFKSHFAFIDTFTNFVNKFKSISNNTSAPVISVDFSKAESEYNYGGVAFALNLAWYSRYKPLGDLIITAFVYVFFIWRFYCRIPELIRGAGIITDNASGSSKEVNKR